MRRAFGCLLFIMLFLIVLPRVAFGHEGHDHGAGGFTSGIAHPLTGVDHLIAMLAIGLWAAQIGGRAVVALPAVFVSMMLAGGAIALSGVHVPAVEPGIIASVLVLGLLIAAAAKLPLGAGIIITTLFAFIHGAAHGQELGDSSPRLFALGAMLASTLLHIAGALLGTGIKAKLGAMPVRVTGGIVAALGLLMAVGAL